MVCFIFLFIESSQSTANNHEQQSITRVIHMVAQSRIKQAHWWWESCGREEVRCVCGSRFGIIRRAEGGKRPQITCGSSFALRCPTSLRRPRIGRLAAYQRSRSWTQILQAIARLPRLSCISQTCSRKVLLRRCRLGESSTSRPPAFTGTSLLSTQLLNSYLACAESKASRDASPVLPWPHGVSDSLLRIWQQRLIDIHSNGDCHVRYFQAKQIWR